MKQENTYVAAEISAADSEMQTDLACKRVFLDVEAQKEYRPGYPIEKRGFYYISRLLSSQLENITEGTGYAGLQKVYSIWICLGKDIPKGDQQTITRFYVAKEDVIGSARSKPEDYDLLELVILRLGNKETEHYLLGMLTTLFWKKMSVNKRIAELEEIYGIPMKRKLKEEVGNMCTYSAAIRERAEEEGREEGRKEERERLHSLYQKLKADNRVDDLMKAVDDMDYQNQLLEEYGL